MDYNPTHVTGKIYYWIKANYMGKTILILPKGEASLTEESATRYGYEKLPCTFEVVGLPTRVTASASRMLKGRNLDETADIDKSLERYRHPSLEGR